MRVTNTMLLQSSCPRSHVLKTMGYRDPNEQDSVSLEMGRVVHDCVEKQSMSPAIDSIALHEQDAGYCAAMYLAYIRDVHAAGYHEVKFSIPLQTVPGVKVEGVIDLLECDD